MFININLPFIVIFIKFFWITDAVVEYYYGYYPYIYGSNVNAAYRYPYGYYGTYNYNYLSSYLNNFYANSKNLSPTLQNDIQKILQDITALMQHEAHDIYRFKRAAANNNENKDKSNGDNQCKPRRKSLLGECCSDSVKTAPLDEHLQEIRQQCLLELHNNAKIGDQSEHILSCENDHITINHLICLSDCFAKNMNIINSNGELNKAELLAYVEDVLCHADWQKEIAKEVTDRCVNEVTQSSHMEYKESDVGVESKTEVALPPVLFSYLQTHHSCNPITLKFTICVWREFAEKCLKRDSIVRKCIRLQERYDDFIASRIPPRDHIIIGI